MAGDESEKDLAVDIEEKRGEDNSAVASQAQKGEEAKKEDKDKKKAAAATQVQNLQNQAGITVAILLFFALNFGQELIFGLRHGFGPGEMTFFGFLGIPILAALVGAGWSMISVTIAAKRIKGGWWGIGQTAQWLLVIGWLSLIVVVAELVGTGALIGQTG